MSSALASSITCRGQIRRPTVVAESLETAERNREFAKGLIFYPVTTSRALGYFGMAPKVNGPQVLITTVSFPPNDFQY